MARTTGAGPAAAHALSGLSLAVALAALLAAGCSTAPDPAAAETEVLIQRRQAVDWSRQGDENLVGGNYTQAEALYRKSLEANWAVDNLAGVVQACFSLGYLYQGLGHLDEADAQFAEGLDAASLLGDAGLVADARINQAKVLLARNDPGAALALLDDVKAALPSGGTGKDARIRLATLLHLRGSALKDLGRLGEAKADLEAAYQLNLGLKTLKEPAANLYVLASIANREGDLEGALALLYRALDYDKRAEKSTGISDDLYAIAQVLRRLPGPDGQPRKREAWDYLRRSYKVALAANDLSDVRRDLAALVELAGELGLADEQARYRALQERLAAAEGAAAGQGTPAAPAHP